MIIYIYGSYLKEKGALVKDTVVTTIADATNKAVGETKDGHLHVRRLRRELCQEA